MDFDLYLYIFFGGGLECVGHSFAYVAHLWFLRDVWIRTQSTAVASWHATDLATHPSIYMMFKKGFTSSCYTNKSFTRVKLSIYLLPHSWFTHKLIY